ncbi:hypothetical protein [Spirosoma utsteinense]|uniref:Membrane protein n=1 Tax=Spirosoma utsteinense TaxID=2585773 RepID=A0ABR6W8G9_9BACT|nr:hypothetical protein [Spirosoma utsteinense]MBC3784099.1 putative membrane protein [Spirosoma utsteinense]MBC3792812.1 putative membrane protein [Spirosoma utsteinense]
MKTTLLIITGLLVSTVAATAQIDNNNRNDHTYSTHNYKHANKAAEASRWEQKTGTLVVAPVSQGTVANYKQPQPATTPTGGVSLPASPPASVASRNYKAGNQPATADQSQYVNRSGSKSSADKSTVGD